MSLLSCITTAGCRFCWKSQNLHYNVIFFLFRWYYEGRNGWWQYDDRTQPELERAHREGQTSVVMLIAGFNYQIDFSAMLQYRVNDPNRKRAIKREKVNAPLQIKGIAGIRTDNAPGSSTMA